MRIFPLAFALACLAACAHGPGGAAHLVRERGLWIGPIQVCRDTAESAVAGTEPYSALSNLNVTLKPGQRARLQAETERLVGSAMPIRLDGRVISEPIVYEPITGGVLSLAGLAGEEADAIRAAIREPC
jgi:preprotein translocase subunit SecD